MPALPCLEKSMQSLSLSLPTENARGCKSCPTSEFAHILQDWSEAICSSRCLFGSADNCFFQEETRETVNVFILSNKSRTGAGGMSVNTPHKRDLEKAPLLISLFYVWGLRSRFKSGRKFGSFTPHLCRNLDCFLYVRCLQMPPVSLFGSFFFFFPSAQETLH